MTTTTDNKPNSLVQRLAGKAAAFIVAPASAKPLACFRIGLTAVLLLQGLSIARNLTELYGQFGIVQRDLVESITPGGIPRIGWLVDRLAPYGVSDMACVRTVFLLYITSLACLLIGWQTRVAAVLAWVSHMALNVSGNMSIYGVDQFANIALFYCVVMPVGHTLSADRSGRPETLTPYARIALRVLQAHLCVVYFASGIEKATGVQWRNGEAIWRAVTRPGLGQFDLTWLAAVPWLAMAICWGTLFVEIGYAFLVWPSRTRKLIVLATISMHAGIAVTLGLGSFAGVMIVLNAAAFLISPEPPVGVPGRRIGWLAGDRAVVSAN
jgi:hypothetical protein